MITVDLRVTSQYDVGRFKRGRERVAATVAQARQEFASAKCEPMTAAEILREAQS